MSSAELALHRPDLADGGTPSGSDNLLSAVVRQWWTERRLRRRGIDFRTDDPAAARAAYSRMSPAEFDAINARQAWANRRTVARSLAGLLPDRPLRAVDLGSGTGESTRVLARLLPAGSRVLGLEFAAPIAEFAAARDYHGPDGNPADVRFRTQSIADPFRDADGRPLPGGSVDVVNACGVLAHHLGCDAVEACLSEVARVLRPGGVAALDPGPELPAADLRARAARHGLGFVRRTRSNPLDRCGQSVFRREPSPKGDGSRRPR